MKKVELQNEILLKNADEKLRELGYLEDEKFMTDVLENYKRIFPENKSIVYLKIRRSFLCDYLYYRKEGKLPSKGGYELIKARYFIGDHDRCMIQHLGFSAEELQILAQKAKELDSFFERNPDKLPWYPNNPKAQN